MSETAVYIAPAVAAVRALWDGSGRLAGPDVRAQLSRFAEASLAAHAAGERSTEVLVSNWSEDGLPSTGTLAMLGTSAHPQAAGVSAEIERMLATT